MQQEGKLAEALWCTEQCSAEETLSPDIHVDATLTLNTYLNIAEQMHPFTAAGFPDGSGLFQKETALCHT